MDKTNKCILYWPYALISNKLLLMLCKFKTVKIKSYTFFWFLFFFFFFFYSNLSSDAQDLISQLLKKVTVSLNLLRIHNKLHVSRNQLGIQWNPDFSNLQGKRKLVREIGGKITVFD